MKTLNEASVNVEGHVVIRDMDTNEQLLNKHNAINFQNFALAMANSLANKTDANGKSFIVSKLAFGYGGSTIDSSGNITYKEAKVQGGSGALYNASLDNSVTPAVHLQVPVTEYSVNDAANEPYTDLACKVVLDYNYPADASTLDTATNYETASEFVFDEIALVAETGDFLTHLVFHPIQKSKNRKLEILYTLRIRAGV